MEYCPSCGEKLPQDANTCPHCGYRLTQEDIERNAQITKPTEKKIAQKKKSSKGKIAIIIVACIVLLSLLGRVIADIVDDGQFNLSTFQNADSNSDDADDTANDDNHDKNAGDDNNDNNDWEPSQPTSKGIIAVIAKGETHAFWQAVKAGAVAAANERGYELSFRGPNSESPDEIPYQHDMVEAALANPDTRAIVLATIGNGFSDLLTRAYDKGVPVVEFDSGIWYEDRQSLGAQNPLVAGVATDNKLAGALAAENLYAYLKENGKLHNGYKVGIIQHDSTTTGTNRAEGFIKKIEELAKKDGISIEINLQAKQNNAGEYKLGLTALDEWGAQSIFMTNQGVVNEVYPEVGGNADAYKDILFCGMDAGTNQYMWIKDAGTNCALLVGSVAQDSYSMGYYAVKTAIDKLEGKEISDVGIVGAWYNKDNVDYLKDQNIFYMG